MKKVTVLYGHPKSPEEFEKYYANTHLPLAGKMPNISRIELTKFEGGPDGDAAFYRMAEMYFEDQQVLEQTLGSPEGQATVGDLPNFASGGVTMVIGTVEG